MEEKLKVSPEAKERGFDKYRVNDSVHHKRSLSNRNLRQKFKDSIYKPSNKSLERINDDYTPFMDLPGVSERKESLFSVSSQMNSNRDSVIFKNLKNLREKNYKDWIKLFAFLAIGALFCPLMIMIPHPITYKLFWVFCLVVYSSWLT
jgi:hypothetical protein